MSPQSSLAFPLLSTHHCRHPSPLHSFTPGLNLPFLQILPTVAFLFFLSDSMDSPDCLLILLSISVKFFLLSLSYLIISHRTFSPELYHLSWQQQQQRLIYRFIYLSHQCAFICRQSGVRVPVVSSSACCLSSGGPQVVTTVRVSTVVVHRRLHGMSHWWPTRGQHRAGGGVCSCLSTGRPQIVTAARVSTVLVHRGLGNTANWWDMERQLIIGVFLYSVK